MRSAQSPAFNIPWSVLSLEPGDNAGFFRATEFIHGPDAQEPAQPVPAEKSWLGNTGVFVPFSSTEYLMMVRSFLDVRLYFLSKVSDAPLTLRGVVFQPQDIFHISSIFSATPRQPAFEIKLTRGESGEPSTNR